MKPIADRQLKEMRKYVREKALPMEVGRPDQMQKEHYRKLLEHLGFRKIREDGNQFLCVFPKGWRKHLPAGFREFCYLLDNRKRKRAAIFYKFMGGVTEEEAKEHNIPLEKIKSFKKISSHINWMQRYRTKIDHVVPMSHKKRFKSIEHYNSPLIGKVMDHEDIVLYETEPLSLPEYDEKEREKYFSFESAGRTDLFVECETWLNKKYPEHTNILKYWEDE
jgi:hypothetical protein